MMHMGIGASMGMGFVAIMNFAFLFGGLVALVLAVIVLIKLNKALSIWLADHNNKGAL